MGALGSPNRLDSTVVGDHVNIAARLEQLTKKYDSQILISQHTFQEIQLENYHVREIDMLKLKGKEIPILVYEVLDCGAPEIIEKKLSILEVYKQGIAAYKNHEFSQAVARFSECLQIFPEDKVSLDYLKRSDDLQKSPPPVREFE